MFHIWNWNRDSLCCLPEEILLFGLLVPWTGQTLNRDESCGDKEREIKCSKGLQVVNGSMPNYHSGNKLLVVFWLGTNFHLGSRKNWNSYFWSNVKGHESKVEGQVCCNLYSFPFFWLLHSYKTWRSFAYSSYKYPLRLRVIVKGQCGQKKITNNNVRMLMGWKTFI